MSREHDAVNGIGRESAGCQPGAGGGSGSRADLNSCRARGGARP